MYCIHNVIDQPMGAMIVLCYHLLVFPFWSHGRDIARREHIILPVFTRNLHANNRELLFVEILTYLTA